MSYKLTVRDLRDYDELEHCIELGIPLNTDTIFPYDLFYLKSNLFMIWKSGCLFKVIENNNESNNKIIAWGVAKIVAPQVYNRDKQVTQIIYQCKAKGILAVKSLLVFHESMIQYAIENKIGRCVTSSVRDNYDVFCRILEKVGWIRKGSTLIYLLDNPNYDPSTIYIPTVLGRNPSSQTLRFQARLGQGDGCPGG